MKIIKHIPLWSPVVDNDGDNETDAIQFDNEVGGHLVFYNLSEIENHCFLFVLYYQVLDGLKEQYERVVMVDMLGFGLSDKPVSEFSIKWVNFIL